MTFRLDAARELAGDSGNAPERLVKLVGALAASGVPLRGRRVRLEGPWRAVRAGPVDGAGPAGGGVHPAHLRAARRLPRRQLLAALPDGAGARSRAVRRGVRAAAGAGDPEHRHLAHAGRPELGGRARLGRGAPDRPARGGGDRLPRRPRASRATAPWWCWAPPTSSTTPTWRRRTPTSGACPPGSATPTWPPWTGCSTSDERPTWVIVAHRSIDVWELDFTKAQRGARRRLRRGGHGRQVHHLPPHRRMTRSIDARVLAVAAYAVALLLWCWLVGIPNDPIGVALWLWLLAICWRLDWCWQFPKDWWPWLLALAVYGLARGVTDDLGFTPYEVWPIRADEWLAQPLGRRRRAHGVPAAPVLRRPVRPERPGAVVRHRGERDVRLALPGRAHHRGHPLASRPRPVPRAGSAAT